MRVFSDLEDVLSEAAAGPDIRKYLHGRGIKTIGTMALVAKDEAAFDANIVAPLMAGWTNGVDTVKIEAHEQPIATAVLLHAWTLAKTSWQRTLAAAAVPSPSPSGGATATASAAPGSSADTKIPKSLPPGKWSELVNHYNNKTLDGKPRHFPVREVLGAEVVIARLWHERHVSHLYTPLQLGEILQFRSFTASGDINPLMKNNRKHNALSLDEDNKLVESEEPTWIPKSVLSVLDGIAACRWALILTQHGEEEDVQSFTDFMQQRARSKPDRMEHMVAYWLASMWKISMAMRSGDSFGVASQAVMQDLETFHDYMNKDVNTLRIKPKPPVKSEIPDKTFDKFGKGGKAKGGGGRQSRYQPYQNQKYRWPQSEFQRWRQNGHQYDDPSGWQPSVPVTYQTWWDKNYK